MNTLWLKGGPRSPCCTTCGTISLDHSCIEVMDPISMVTKGEDYIQIGCLSLGCFSIPTLPNTLSIVWEGVLIFVLDWSSWWVFLCITEDNPVGSLPPSQHDHNPPFVVVDFCSQQQFSSEGSSTKAVVRQRRRWRVGVLQPVNVQ